MNIKLLKQKILDLAIHGRLVPQNPDDEPASQLLRRISEEKEKLIAQGKIKRPKKSDAINPAQECPFEIPNSWEWVKLGEIVSVLGDGIHGTPNYDNPDDYYFINGNNLVNGVITTKIDTKRVSKNEYDKYCKPLNNSTVLVSINGTIGNVAFYNNEKIILGKSACYFNLLIEDIKFYIYYLIKTQYFLDYAFYYATGSTIKNVSLATMNDLRVPLPPLAEQTRIVSAIEKWFSLIDEIETNKESLQATIKQTKSKVLDLAIKGKLVKKTDEWKMVTISDISKTITGSTPSKKHSEYYGGDFPFYKPSDLDKGRFVDEASEYLTEQGKLVSKIIPPNSIAVCCIGSIGKCGYISKECTTNQQINTIIPNKNIIPLFVYYYCLSDFFIQQLIEKSSAVTISIVNKSKLDSTLIPLPPLSEQTRIVSKIEEVFGLLDGIEKELE